MEAASLLPDPAALDLRLVSTEGAVIVLHVETVRPQARCPDCGVLSSRVHSRYRRTVQDLPWQGVAIRLLLLTRRLFCSNPTCPRAIFTERLPNVVGRYARRTGRLQMAITLLGYALGGEAGARIAASLAMAASPDTLLRRVREEASRKDSDRSAGDTCGEAIRVVGVDDWAFRRGRRYGTIVVDLERHCVVDLLPDRGVGTLAEWLRNHPGVQILSRDRAEAYAEAARIGAATAQQVADRWHLFKNLGDALEALLNRNYRRLSEAAGMLRTMPGTEQSRTSSNEAPESDRRPGTAPDPEAGASAPPCEPDLRSTRADREKATRHQKRHARWNEVKQLHRQGLNVSSIARQTGLSRQTVRAYVQAETCPQYRACRRRRTTLLQAFLPSLKRQWEEGCHNGAQLWREIQKEGYSGRYTAVKDLLRQWRAPASAESCGASDRQGPAWRKHATPSPGSVRLWVMGSYTSAEPAKQAWQRRFVDALKAVCPEVGDAQKLAERFIALMRDKTREGSSAEFERWREDAAASAIPEIAAFAKGLGKDQDAVRAALTSEWSNGQTEGQVNRLKLIKRQMYGRANFDLLRARVMPMARSA